MLKLCYERWVVFGLRIQLLKLIQGVHQRFSDKASAVLAKVTLGIRVIVGLVQKISLNSGKVIQVK